ncbi:transcriptional initiation protein Tat [Rhodoblastus acidophilus]|uniref:Transcriptional initiation protein Tat n=1 Tax=Candidatus Rhodoblastus alkanivorans TaxID=2954117 RepID=A0ABS9Z8W0_9HYPH|nr:transcriptional initiation protein Tat [Candidatus Rhodoblastus alkanivorans]MCI4680703.1 transcriptional initiation protein Tat [Candidatus Rhodoblastus alkanivorans]MCI4684027.1 transcriptional initiation protein Tat [Candidatus Rhodoblastus alkanivorans]MDI4641346.1 transcriptional initiation protein Tat [Rhodoblastus acidophilus]
MTDAVLGRRDAILAMGLGLTAALAADGSAKAAESMVLPAGSSTLADLVAKLEKAPRRRDFKSVPMILTDKNYWDHEALADVLSYRGSPRQAWDNTDIASPWLNGMRNALNAQVFGFKHANFLVVSATHGTAHFALLDQAMWDKYQLAKLIKDKFEKNTFIAEQPGAKADPKDFENAEGVFSGHNVSIPALMRRGVVFLACHNTMWEVSEKLMKAGINPDKLSHDAMAAELTNHIIPGCVLTPGIVGTLPELAAAGYSYVK